MITTAELNRANPAIHFPDPQYIVTFFVTLWHIELLWHWILLSSHALVYSEARTADLWFCLIFCSEHILNNCPNAFMTNYFSCQLDFHGAEGSKILFLPLTWPCPGTATVADAGDHVRCDFQLAMTTSLSKDSLMFGEHAQKLSSSLSSWIIIPIIPFQSKHLVEL